MHVLIKGVWGARVASDLNLLCHRTIRRGLLVRNHSSGRLSLPRISSVLPRLVGPSARTSEVALDFHLLSVKDSTQRKATLHN